MVQENEIIMLLIGVGILFFILANRLRLNSLPASKMLILGFYVILAGWFLTVLEGFYWNGILNILEHICYAGSSVLVALWCWRVFGSRKEDK
jgi:uncharacterized membrane protein